MAKIYVKRIVSAGRGARVILSNGDELYMLTDAAVSSGLDKLSTFKIEGYIGPNSDQKAERP
jgi:hypothetical protein